MHVPKPLLLLALVVLGAAGLWVARTELHGYAALEPGSGRSGAEVSGSSPRRLAEAGDVSELTVSCRPGQRFTLFFAVATSERHARTVELVGFRTFPGATRGLATTSVRPTDPMDGSPAGPFRPQRLAPGENREYRLDGVVRSCATRALERADADHGTSAVIDGVDARVRVGWVEHVETIPLPRALRILG